MSTGGGASETTQTVEIPQEFKDLVFGVSPSPGFSGTGSVTQGENFDNTVGFGRFNQTQPNSINPRLGNIFPQESGTPQVQVGTGIDPGFGGSLPGVSDALSLAFPEADTFKGILPEAVELFREGGLSNQPVQGQTTRQALEDRLTLADTLQSGFLPQVQSLFNTPFENRSQDIADIATANLRRQLEREALPTISQGAIDAGQLGSSRQGIAEGLVRSEAERDISDVTSQILFQGAQLEEQALGKRLGFAPVIAQLLGLPSQITAEVGAVEDTFQQQTDAQDFENLLRLSQLTQGFIPGANQTTVQDSAGGGTSGRLQGALGGAATGFAVTKNPYGALAGAALGLLSGG